MATSTYTSGAGAHNVVGELAGGLKMVFSDFRTLADGTSCTVLVRIDPLQKVFAWAWGQKEDNTGGATCPMDVVQGGTFQDGLVGNTTTSSTLFNIKNTITTVSGVIAVTIMTIGV